ncbi:MAG TPA: bifunctional DNA primase/polymerase [Roseiarcus sp.]|nr:bifunctional DNA primase/polymerase [Roseiarcus sp.]
MSESSRRTSAARPISWAALIANWNGRPAANTNCRSAANTNGPVVYAYDSVNGPDGDPEERSQLDWALFYARRDMRVFPVAADKKPLTAHGFKDAATEEKQIREWWRKWPYADVGWAVPSDVVVVDLDVKHQKNVIAEFEKRMGCSCADLETPLASSPTGGRHAVFGANGHKYANTVRVDGCAIDLRTEGGYIVLPGATNGRRWLKPLDGPRANAPDWVPTAGNRRAKAAPAPSPNGANGAGGDDPDALAFLEEACTAIGAASNGDQEKTLHRKCYAVGGLVGAKRLRQETALARLWDAAAAMTVYRDNEPWGDLTGKVRASLEAGSQKPWSPRLVIEITGGDLAREADEAEQALSRACEPIFTRNLTLVRAVPHDAPASQDRRTSVTILKTVNVDVMTDWLSKYADFVKKDGRGGKIVRVDPPERVARIVLNRANATIFPPITGVITTPTLRPDGSILEQEGYDAATRLFLTLDKGFKLPPIADKPTQKDAGGR